MPRTPVRWPAANAGDRWLSMVLHELRNPLQPLRGALALARRRGAGDTVLQRSLEAAERQLALLQRLLDDLSGTLAGNGPQALRLTRVSMRRVVEQAVLHTQAPVDGGAGGLRCSIEAGDHDVRGDEDRLLQVVLNLLSNALKYTPPRGRVDVLLRMEQGRVVLEVRDEGRGLAPDELTCIFQPFRRGRGVGATPGWGVGLAVVQAIVERHGGAVQACSPGPGLGSTFTVTLPGHARQRPRRAVRTALPRC